MKKLIFILVAFFFVAVSCQKADIRPNMHDNNSCDLCDDDFSKLNNNGDDDSLFDDGTGDTGGITDPNNDEDEDKGKKVKKK